MVNKIMSLSSWIQEGGGGPLHLEIKGKFLVGENKKNTVSTLFTDIWYKMKQG